MSPLQVGAPAPRLARGRVGTVLGLAAPGSLTGTPKSPMDAITRDSPGAQAGIDARRQSSIRETLALMQSRFAGRKGFASGDKLGKENKQGVRSREPSTRRGRDEGETSDEEEEEEDEMVFEPPTPPSEMTADHVQIHKLCKLLKGGDPTTTIVALSSLAGFDLTQRKFQLAVRDVGGLEPLVLLLGAEIPKIRVGAAELLKHVTRHPHMQLLFNQLHGIAPLIAMLTSQDTREISGAAAALTTLAMSSTWPFIPPSLCCLELVFSVRG